MVNKTQKMKVSIALLKNILLCFVLISIGFALGKTVASKRSPGVTAKEPVTIAGRKVSVVYAHTPFRCVTCNTIEELARETVMNRFAEEFAAGLVEWRTVNFQEDEAFAEQYSIASSCLVVVLENDGAETGFRRLDDVWTRYQDPEAFESYVADAIRDALAAATGEFK